MQLFSVENFQDSGPKRQINSPRTLEACLRSGLDPMELNAKTRKDFLNPNLTDKMIDIEFEAFGTKRLEKIKLVTNERSAIIAYADRKRGEPGATDSKQTGFVGDDKKKSAVLELEEQRMEALRRRQEKEISKIVEREQTMVALQVKIAHTEGEEKKKKRMHEKKVLEGKMMEAKKQKQRAKEVLLKEQGEAETKRLLDKKEADFERKMKKEREEQDKQLVREAQARDKERAEKAKAHNLKTESLIDAQFQMAEKNRERMVEREERVQHQLVQKKEEKKREVEIQREKSVKLINEALEKHHLFHEEKKKKFYEQEEAAQGRAKTHAKEEREKLKKMADDRDKKQKVRTGRLVDAYNNRKSHRNEIVARRNEKDQTFDMIQAERNEQIAMMKFSSALKLADKQENVERVARVNEFHLLQIQQKIAEEDGRYAKIQFEKGQLMGKHREEVKCSLIRKHGIADAMESMRTSNDFSLLDTLFAGSKKGDKGEGKGRTNDDGAGDADPRLNQTI